MPDVDLTYHVGTCSVAVGATSVVGVGTLWSQSANVRQWDFISIDGGPIVPIVAGAVDDTHITIPAWAGTAKAGVTYVIYQVSPLRFVGGQAMADVDSMLARLNTEGWYRYVNPAFASPTAQGITANEGQFALKYTTGQIWIMTSGAWMLVGTFKPFGIAAPYDNAKTYNLQDVATLNGSSYVWNNSTPGSGHAPPNATYWAVLASIGATGNTGPAAWQPPAAWVTATAYTAGPPASVVVQAGETYVCLTSHTSGTFATDLAAAKWIKVATKGAGDLSSAANLSDLASAATARANLAVPGLAAANTFTNGTQTISPATGSAFLNINPQTAAQQAGINLSQSNVPIWQVLKQSDGSFLIYDVISGIAVISAGSNTGALAFNANATISGTLAVSGAATFSQNNNHRMGTSGAGDWFDSITTGANRFFLGTDTTTADQFRLYSVLSGAQAFTYQANATPANGVFSVTGSIAPSNAAQTRTNLGTVGVVKTQKFTASGTYTPSAGMVSAVIECIGGGAGGGGVASAGAGNGAAAGGGGAGSPSRTYVTAATIGASKTVTIGAAGTAGASTNGTGGAGGDTSVGTLCIGKGGSGGVGGSGGLGGLGGVAGTGDVTGTGEPGGTGINQAIITIGTRGARGGSSAFGGGGLEVYTAGTAANGNAGTGYGSGGGGGANQNGAGASTGGAGTSGLVIITEYCTA